MFVYTVDEEISLKLIEMKDASRIFQLTNRSRPYLRNWLPWLDQTRKIGDTEAFIQHALKGLAENKSMTTMILLNGQAVGVASYNSLDWANKIAYIGYWLGEDYQGKGIMTKAAGALTDYAFQELGMNKVEIRAAVENKRSRRIPERLGFVEEGTIRQAEWLYDHYVDHVVYGLLKDEWKKRKSKKGYAHKRGEERS
ncbi:GNAT family N-acetyltransferase [Bacillus thermotolerans]|uniref:Ribosomal-protein-L7p-serine acetyltransferase n=1 Tax=Bacillus thermotolerans TaxID=1221996 RepID=A0A0F5HY57_BACTR|nr:GNAT family protein [Bacillus thermotolerans]KKB37985.1 Ribosomal-protein-L7p-serine acetyltransferase [Bacillus thermotolerans]KKB40647.1 Ribosomal-protein-L7p-serine acetyltransferase [Bacillus thermotolerans]KKB43818.1 Ribosomal-protein-L7p-serine acetyltransferase [Bacillus thermotolerans]